MTAPRTDYDVEGTNARRSTAASLSSPAAAQRGAEGAGLDGGEPGRSTISAVRHERCIGFSTGAMAPNGLSITPRFHTSLTDVTRWHGVAVVLSLQAEHLAREGFQVFVGGPIGRREFRYGGCVRIYLDNHVEAADFAVRNDVDCVVIHTPPFFRIVRLLGDWPRTIIYDYGEPPELFPDAAARREVLADNHFAFGMANRVYAISGSVRDEGGFAFTGIIPLANTHLATWDETSAERRRRRRATLGLQQCTVVLNVCRFHLGERAYKGLDIYSELLNDLHWLHPDLKDQVVFVPAARAMM